MFMRYLRILLLHFQDALTDRSRSLVWFLIALFNPILLLLFWSGVYREESTQILNWSLSDIAGYYFLLIIAGALLMTHIEETVGYEDIQYGGLVKFLVKPFAYFWLRFCSELPYRVIQGFFGIVVYLLFRLILGNFISFQLSLFQLILALLILVLAYFISFTFKMIVGIASFWIIDAHGLQNLVGAIILIFAGYIMPLELYPHLLNRLAMVLPFAYMIYWPVVAVQGKLVVVELVRVIFSQFLWLVTLVTMYKLVWKNGVKKFTGVGQ